MKRLSAILVATLLLLLTLMNVTTAPVNAAQPDSPAAPLADLLVRFRDAGPSATTSREVAQILERVGGVVEADPLAVAGTYRLLIESDHDVARLTAELRQYPQIVYVEPNELIELPEFSAHLIPADPGAASQWALERIEAFDAWDLALGAGVTVAVLDTGVSSTHPELAGRILPGWDFVNGDPDATDDAGHGTYIAGVIAAAHDGQNLAGMAPEAVILPVKVLNAEGTGSTANFAAGIVYAVDAGARVINISAGGVSNSQTLLDAINYAENNGVVIVSSTGNDGAGFSNYPAYYPSVLAVSASTEVDTVAEFSTRGPFVDIAAPGVDIHGTWWSAESGDGYAIASGTSAATPYVTGTAALLLQLNSELTASQVRHLLTSSALDIDRPGLDERSGYGRLDAALAARMSTNQPGARTALLYATDENNLIVSADGFRADEALTVWTESASQRRVFRDGRAGADGRVSMNLGPLDRYDLGTLRAVVHGAESRLLALAEHTVQSNPVHSAFFRVEPVVTTENLIYFPETGHTLSHGFKQFWEANGGLAVFGYPISEEFRELNPDTGEEYTVQYFERNRFEYHPEMTGTQWRILLGRLGVQLTRSHDFPDAVPGVAANDLLVFPETGHSISGPFRQFWEANGGLQLFGFPISEPIEENGRLVQHFERNRFEFHPDLAPEYQVLLGRLGVDLARQNGYLR